MNNNADEFTLEVSSDLDYEKMVINLYFSNNHIAILDCDEGIDKAKIAILDRYTDNIVWSFDYQNFIQSLKLAYEKLKEVNN